jgi:hypothetical protein
MLEITATALSRFGNSSAFTAKETLAKTVDAMTELAKKRVNLFILFSSYWLGNNNKNES